MPGNTETTQHGFEVILDPRPPTKAKTEEIAVKIMAAISDEPANDVVQALTSVLGSVTAHLCGNMERSASSIAKIAIGLTQVAEAMHGLDERTESEAEKHNRVTMEAVKAMANAAESPDGFLTMLESVTIGSLILHQRMTKGPSSGPAMFAHLLAERVSQRLAVAAASTDGRPN